MYAMMFSRFPWLAVIAGLLLLAGCSKPETPQEVAAAFWQAMAENDAGDVVALSTLTDEKQFDAYKRDWTNAVPSFGRVVIEEREATIVTRLPTEEGTEGERLELETYLVSTAEGWLVDYQRTGDAILNPSPFSGLMGQLNSLGEKLSASFSESSEDLEARMNELSRDLEAYSDELRLRAESAMEDFAEALQEAMKDLEESLNDSLEDNDQAPREDRVILEQASRDLDQKAEALDEPTAENLAGATRAVAEARENLSHLGSETWAQYRDHWEARLDEIRADTRAFFEDLGQG